MIYQFKFQGDTSVIVPDKLVRLCSAKSNNRRWFAALIALCSLIAFSCNAAYADPDFAQVAGGTSPDSPALTFFNHIPIMMVRANDSTNAILYSINKGAWIHVPTGTTKAAPALVTWGSHVVAVHIGEDGNFYSMVMSNGSAAPSSWTFNSSWTLVQGAPGQAQTNLRPSLTVGLDNFLYLVATFTDRSINLTNATGVDSQGNIQWAPEFAQLPGEGVTNSSASAAFSNNVLTVFQTGADRNLYVEGFDLSNDVQSEHWTQLPGLVAPGALSFGTAASVIDSNGDIVVCGVDRTVLRIVCAQVTVIETPSPASTQTISFELGAVSALNVPGVPEMMRSPTMAFDSGIAMAVAATFSNPRTAQPGVWLSAVKSFSAIVTAGQ